MYPSGVGEDRTGRPGQTGQPTDHATGRRLTVPDAALGISASPTVAATSGPPIPTPARPRRRARTASSRSYSRRPTTGAATRSTASVKAACAPPRPHTCGSGAAREEVRGGAILTVPERPADRPWWQLLWRWTGPDPYPPLWCIVGALGPAPGQQHGGVYAGTPERDQQHRPQGAHAPR